GCAGPVGVRRAASPAWARPGGAGRGGLGGGLAVASGGQPRTASTLGGPAASGPVRPVPGRADRSASPPRRGPLRRAAARRGSGPGPRQLSAPGSTGFLSRRRAVAAGAVLGNPLGLLGSPRQRQPVPRPPGHQVGVQVV